MVGSVLLQRMREENDFAGIEPVFFSTSNAGGAAPAESAWRSAQGRLELKRPRFLRRADQLSGRRIYLGSLQASSR